FETPGGDLQVVANLDIARWTGERFVAARPNLPAAIRSMGWGWHHLHMQDHLGEWWVPTGEGLVRFPRLSRAEELSSAVPVHVYTTRDGLSSDNVFVLYEDRSGDIWIVVLGAGDRVLHRWERSTGRIHVYPLPGRFSGVAPVSFAEDPAGHLWIGLDTGGLAPRAGGRFGPFPPL